MELQRYIIRNLNAFGYVRMNWIFPGIQIWSRNYQDEIYAVLFLFKEEGKIKDEWEYLRFYEGVLNQLQSQGMIVKCLGVIVTECPEQVRNFSNMGVPTWIIDSRELKLLIYENQNSEFLDMQKLLEDSLAGRHAAWTERAAYQKFKKHIPYCTLTIIAVNIVVFIIMELQKRNGGSDSLFYNLTMYWPSVVEDSEYYRLFTCMFLHFGISHLLNNMLVLFLIGSKVEELTSGVRYLILYFFSGIVAGIASMVYNMSLDYPVFSAGASGAIFGIVGAMVWIVVANRGQVEGMSTRQIILFTGLSLMNGFANQQTDNAAHIGGLVSGILLALFLYGVKSKKKEVNRQNES